MNRALDLFPGLAERRIKTHGAEIFLRSAGAGLPLLLVHGCPQTHVSWHRVAAELVGHATLVLAALRGYDASSAPPDLAGHLAYAQRSMAADCLAVMRSLGHQRFMVGGHDRPSRVAYRLALDHREAVIALLPIDSIPTAEVWRRPTAEGAIASYRWGLLAPPAPMPAGLIASDPGPYLEHTLKRWSQPRDRSPFSREALQHCRALLQEPAWVQAICEDYRAGASIARLLDEADLAAGRKISGPTFLTWGSAYLGQRGLKPLEVWRACSDGSGTEIPSGHFLAEEKWAATLAALLPFITAQGGAR